MARYESLNYVFTFGKYKGENWKDVAKKNINYLWWCAANVKNFREIFFKQLTDTDIVFISDLDWDSRKKHKRVLNNK